MFEKIRKLIAEQLYLDENDVKEDSAFVDDLGADSLDIVQMLMAMEKEFGVSFEDDELTTIKTVSDAIALIEKKK
ncbi:MAG: acyl carrier protein [Clostridia bacterium]|jgi:acyl carrier protein|nr:acyl carrier protein [Clostridia bacterium]